MKKISQNKKILQSALVMIVLENFLTSGRKRMDTIDNVKFYKSVFWFLFKLMLNYFVLIYFIWAGLLKVSIWWLNAITNENNIKVTLKCSVLSSTSSLQKIFLKEWMYVLVLRVGPMGRANSWFCYCNVCNILQLGLNTL